MKLLETCTWRCPFSGFSCCVTLSLCVSVRLCTCVPVRVSVSACASCRVVVRNALKLRSVDVVATASGEDVKAVINNVSFGVAPGARLGLLGTDGCGASELLDVIAGVQSLSSGTVTVLGLHNANFAAPSLMQSMMRGAPAAVCGRVGCAYARLFEWLPV